MVSLRMLFGEESDVLQKTNFQLLLVATLLPPLGTALLSPVIESLITPLGTSPANVGLIMSVFTAPAIILIPLTGVLADRYGRKPVLVVSLLLFGIGGTGIAFTTDFRLVLLMRFIQGVGFGGINPTIITCIGDLYTGDTEATAQGLRFTSAGLSSSLLPLLSGLLVLVSWQYPFFLYALAFPAAIVLHWYFEEPATIGTPAIDGGSRESYRRELVAVLRHRRVQALVIARATPNVFWIAFLTYNSLIVVRLMSGTPAQAGLLVTLSSFTFAAVASQAGRITSLFTSRFSPLVVGNACLVVGFAIVFLAPDLWLTALGLVIGSIGFGVLLSLYRSVITGLGPDHLRAGLVGIAEAGGRVSNTLIPILMGAVIGVATPIVGFTQAIRVAGLGATALAGTCGLVCLVIARYSPPVSVDRATQAGQE